MRMQRFSNTQALHVLICLGFLVFCGSSAAENTPQRELSARNTEVRGSKDYRDIVEIFLNRDTLKIIGGTVAPDGSYPWQVSLLVSWIAEPSQAHFCGGSIYNAKWVVTAAHCVADNQPQDIHVVAGVNKLVKHVARTNVRRIIIHKSYNAQNNDNDIALLELWDELILDKRTQPITLLTSPDEDKLLTVGQKLTVTGWGATQEGGPPVKDLRYVEIPAVSRDTCNEPPSYYKQITDNMVCAGRALGGKDSCQGDSGGPLITDPSAGEPKLAGIVSWGEGCAKPAKYGIYTRVAHYSEWVRQCTSAPNAC